VRNAYRQRGDGAPANVRRDITSVDDGVLAEYGALLPESAVMGACLLDWGFGSGDSWTAVTLFDQATGELTAFIDGTAWNRHKVGATGAIAVDELARVDASRMAIIGSGTQARSQLRYTARVRDLDEINVYSPTQSNRDSFAEELDPEFEASVNAVSDSDVAVHDADILVTATSSPKSVFNGRLLPDGAHVTAVGQTTSAGRELDADTIERSVYVLDLERRARTNAGAFLEAIREQKITENHIHAELGEVVAGYAPGRQRSDQVTVFDSGGTGIETIAVAGLLYEVAVSENVGTTVPFSSVDETPTLNI